MLRARAASQDVTVSRVPPAPSRLQARSSPSRSYADIGNQAMLRRLYHTSPHLQCKLTVGAVDDPHEAEADRVADQVMRMPDPDVAVSSGTPRIHRKCASCEEEDKKVHAKPNGTAALPGEAPPIVHDVLSSSGQPLDAATRSFFEPRLGADLRPVRVHSDRDAGLSALAINALAYASGLNIVFAPQHYNPDTVEGKKLLAHELAHVVQQGGVAPQREGDGSPPRLRRTADSTIQRATRKGCFAPSFVVDVATASAFGTLAETLVEADYIAKMGGTPFGNVFLDNPLGPMAYVAFLASHHPSLNVALLAGQIALSGGILVPDILDTRGVKEFYDVKPDSADGRPAGRAKLAAIDAFMSFNSLPYVRGSSYTPTPSLPIPLAGPALAAAITAIGGPALAAPAMACGLPVVTLAPTRAASGLLVYQICIEADLDCYLRVLALEALVAAIIVAVLAAIASGGATIPETVPALTPALAPLLTTAEPPPASQDNSAKAA